MKSEADEDDVKAFREAVRGVKPLPGEPQAPSSRKPPPRARFTRSDRQAVLRESITGDVDDPTLASGEELAFHRGGLQSPILKKLRRGQYRVQAEIDLHGLNVADAKQALRAFLVEAITRDLRCVRVIHGKGLRSGHRGPVLKSAVSGLLRRTGAVVAYVSARQVDGGTGAVYVLLSPS
ncbi:MAG TPA: Smr/MutS family protein [Steroidobacteraceae bacterium]